MLPDKLEAEMQSPHHCIPSVEAGVVGMLHHAAGVQGKRLPTGRFLEHGGLIEHFFGHYHPTPPTQHISPAETGGVILCPKSGSPRKLSPLL